MMASWLREDPGSVDNATTFRVFRSEAKCLDPGESNCACAHGARLQSHPKRTSVEARLAKARSGMSDGDDFRMGSWI